MHEFCPQHLRMEAAKMSRSQERRHEKKSIEEHMRKKSLATSLILKSFHDIGELLYYYHDIK